MRRTLILALAACSALAFASAASAADMPKRTYAQPVYSAPYNWSGFYAGGMVGYGRGHASSTAYFGGVPIGSASGSSSGFSGGVLAGYNWQGNSPLVLGVEGDLGIAKDTPWIASVRGRIGYAFDRWLPYVTAGLAMERVNFGAPGVNWSENRRGWTVGTGVEYAFVNSNWRAGLEYRHTDFGTGSTNAFAPAEVKTRLTNDGVLGRLTYAF